jgi:hypothetical protein
MRSKLFTFSALILCFTFAVRSTPADTVRGDGRSYEFARPFTVLCEPNCAFDLRALPRANLSFDFESTEPHAVGDEFALFGRFETIGFFNGPESTLRYRRFVDPSGFRWEPYVAHPAGDVGIAVAEPGSLTLTTIGLIALALFVAGFPRKPASL